jgi:type II secretory pathway pseudopilin PulG
MSVTNKAGFTIIETMLFLAITGLLVVGILAGTGTSINIQRYHDSVSSFKAVLQQQYADVATVQNGERSDGLSCDSAAILGTSGSLSRGQTDCVVMGRYLTIDSQAVAVSTVIGHPKTSGSYDSDIAELKDYNLAVLPASTENSTLEWNAQIAWPVAGDGAHPTDSTPRAISLLIVRSPTSGLIYTFSNDSITVPLAGMIIGGNMIPGQGQRRICINPNSGGFGFGGGMAVLVGAYASSASSIQVRSNDMGDSSTC